MTKKYKRKPKTTTFAYDLDGNLYTLTAPVKVIAAARRAYAKVMGEKL